MRQKFLIRRNDRENELRIREYAILGREYKHANVAPGSEPYSLIGEETYRRKKVIAAIEKGGRHLFRTLRTRNMYPISPYAEKIAESVVRLYDSDNKRTIELLFDDKSFFENNA